MEKVFPNPKLNIKRSKWSGFLLYRIGQKEWKMEKENFYNRLSSEEDNFDIDCLMGGY